MGPRKCLHVVMPLPEAYHAVESAQNYERERERHRNEEALTYLMESGRSENREAAEQYLSTLNQIKEKLLTFSRDYGFRQSNTRTSGIERPSIGYGELEVTADVLDKVTSEDFDRSNPELWKLERQVEPSYTDYLPEQKSSVGQDGIFMRDRLQISLGKGRPPVEIHPEMVTRGAVTFKELQKYLTEEDLAFVAKEYGFTANDLARTLRAVADRVAKYEGPTDSTLLEHFSPKGRK